MDQEILTHTLCGIFRNTKLEGIYHCVVVIGGDKREYIDRTISFINDLKAKVARQTKESFN